MSVRKYVGMQVCQYESTSVCKFKIKFKIRFKSKFESMIDSMFDSMFKG